MTNADGPSTAADQATAALRHGLATLAYRAAKVLRDVPPGFGAMEFGAATRRPVRIVAHMADLMAWAPTFLTGKPTWKADGGSDWHLEVERFFSGLGEFDRRLADTPPSVDVIYKLMQAPLADALTHVGQLAMLRGMAGHPIRPESYAGADIVAGRVGREQTPARRAFDGDASVPTRS